MKDDYIEFKGTNTFHGGECHPFEATYRVSSDLTLPEVVHAFKSFLLSMGFAESNVEQIKYGDSE